MLKSRQQIIMRMRINGKTMCVAITILIVVVLVITPLIAAYSLYNSVTTYINQVVLNFNRNGFDGLSEVSGLRKLVNEGKTGGFINLQQQTLDRLFIVSQPIPSNGEDSKAKNQGGRSISFFGLDVSHSGEALYIYKRILNRPSFNAKLLIVDIGANDGLLSSNSFNFIQWGWDAILVEPQKKELQYAKYNTRRYRDQKVHEGQHVHFVNAVIGEKTGSVELVVPDDLVSMQAHIKTNNTAQLKGKTVQVPSMTVADLAEEYNIPKYFGILSIDAEGVGDKILRAWISQGFRPFYIIYECLHNNESIRSTNRLLLRSGYTYLTKRGWNYLFEYNLESD